MEAALTYSRVHQAPPSWWVALFKIFRTVATSRPSRHEEHLRSIVEIAGSRLVELLKAPSPDDLELRLERIANSEWFLAVRVLLLREHARLLEEAEHAEQLQHDGQAVEDIAGFLTEVLGRGVEREALHAGQLIIANLTAFRESIESVPEKALPVMDMPSIRRLANSIAIPGPLRRSFQGSLKADACLLLIVRSGERDGSSSLRNAPPWAREAIAEALVENLHQALRLLASIPDSGVSLELVRAEDRFDLDEVWTEAVRADQRVSQIFRDAIEHGEAIYFPFGEPLLDD